MKKIIKIFFIVVVFSIIYMITFHLPIREIVSVYTYYGFLSLFALTIGLILFLLFGKKRKFLKFDIKDSIIVVLLCLFLNAFVFGMLSVTMERSISVFMLNEMSKNEESTKSEIESNFVDKYVYEYDAFDKRLKEQMVIDNIQEENSEYSLSSKGKFTVKIFKLINKIYHVNSKLLD